MALFVVREHILNIDSPVDIIYILNVFMFIIHCLVLFVLLSRAVNIIQFTPCHANHSSYPLRSSRDPLFYVTSIHMWEFFRYCKAFIKQKNSVFSHSAHVPFGSLHDKTIHFLFDIFFIRLPKWRGSQYLLYLIYSF